MVDQYQVDEMVHCAGCLSYFNEDRLRAVNVEMTRRFVDAAKRWGLCRFVHVSTAFACGFVEGPIPERLHVDPVGDPTFYTESSSACRWICLRQRIPTIRRREARKWLLTCRPLRETSAA